MNMVTTGTVMPEPLKKNKIVMRQGDVQSFRKNDKLVLAWRDKRIHDSEYFSYREQR
jgi:uncharacterized lipoprotein YmbA